MIATASNSRPSTHLDLAGAVDVDVAVTIAGSILAGEVTLAPQQHDGRLAAYGAQPDQWVSGALLGALRGLDAAAFRPALDAIESAAVEAAAR